MSCSEYALFEGIPRFEHLPLGTQATHLVHNCSAPVHPFGKRDQNRSSVVLFDGAVAFGGGVICTKGISLVFCCRVHG